MTRSATLLDKYNISCPLIIKVSMMWTVALIGWYFDIHNWFSSSGDSSKLYLLIINLQKQ